MIQKLGVNIIDYLEGRGDLVSGLVMGISRVTIWVIGAFKLLATFLQPSK